MKTIKYIVSLAAVCMLAMSVSARTFEQGEKIYVNVKQSFDWRQDNAYLFLYVWYKNAQGVTSNEQWLSVTQEKDDIYVCEIPVAGEYNWCIFIRKEKNTHNWDDGWKTQTKDSYIPDGVAVDRNLINTFWGDGEITDWRTYTPGTDKIASYASVLRAAGKEEEVHICSQALGGPYSLRVKLKADGQEYDYGNVQCHGWYKSTNGTSWESVDGYAGTPRDGEKEQDILKNNLPSSGTVYYYLHSSKAAGRRLIKLIPDAEGCELDCTITFFGVASSEVNAHDTTYTLDGMVAFGKPCGDLVIECGDKSVTIEAAKAKSPQIFSIEGLPAATTDGKTTTATAKFTGNEGGKKTVTVNIPNVTQGITYKHIDVLVGETTTLDPAGADYSHTHYWYIDGKLTDKQNKLTTTASNQPNTTRYTYRELNPPAGDMEDMMSNGNYEAEDEKKAYGDKWTKSLISDYEFWGKYPKTETDQINFYTDTIGENCVNPNKRNSNGFAVVNKANNFFYTFAKVLPQEGKYFALFDAASDGVANKKAWKAETAKNEKLKLRKGTTYLFSFWAANINNYGEMDNAAKLQFQIEYNGKTEKLGSVLDLGSDDFRNNRWHQCSATFTAKEDANNVTISVINLNINKLNTGNDFALDDIQFRAVSSPTRSVRMQQVFTVETHEPHIYAMTATPKNMPCGVRKYDVTISVNYDNPKGKLVVKDLTANKTVFEGAVPTDHGEWDQKKTKTITYTIDDNLTPAKHEYKAYFDGWTKAEATASSNAPEYSDCPGPDPELKSLTAEAQTMDCDSTAYDVKITVKYINPKGLFIVVDQTTGKTVVSEALPPITEAQWNIDQTYTFTIRISDPELKNHTFKGYFDGWETGAKTGSSVAPKFVKCAEVISLTAEAQPMDCDSTAYDVKLTVEYVNPEGNLVIKDVTADRIVFSEALPAISEDQVNKTLTKVYTTHIVGLEPAEHEFTAYFDGREDGAKSDVSAAPVSKVCCTDGLMFRKWDNVLFINNHDSLYVAYQWYKNGVKLEGDTLQRIYTGSIKMAGTPDIYHCELTLADGTKDLTCKHTFDECPSSAEASKQIDEASVSVRPTRVAAGAAVTVSKTTEEAMMATLRTITGQLIRTAELRDSESTMLMPSNAGVYLLQLQGKETNTTVKIHVY